MNSLVDSSMRRVYDLHGINFNSDEIIDYISEGLTIMGVYCQNLALHCIRVSDYSVTIGKRIGLSDKEIKRLWCASIFHDIGKSNIPLEILEKPSKLTKEEYEVIKTHSKRGYEFVRMRKEMEEVSNIILYHHERFDGKGYPLSIKGSVIPLLSRIIAVSDAYDAMTSERPYRMALSLDSVLNELRNERWKQFDGNIVDCFIDLIDSNCLKPIEMNMALEI